MMGVLTRADLRVGLPLDEMPDLDAWPVLHGLPLREAERLVTEKGRCSFPRLGPWLRLMRRAKRDEVCGVVFHCEQYPVRGFRSVPVAHIFTGDEQEGEDRLLIAMVPGRVGAADYDWWLIVAASSEGAKTRIGVLAAMLDTDHAA